MIAFYKAGGNNNVQIKYLEYELYEVFVEKMSQSGGGDEFAQENLDFSFAKFIKRYWPQNSDGSQGDVIETSFDVAKNKKG